MGCWFQGPALAAGLSALLASAAADPAVKLASLGYLLYCSDVGFAGGRRDCERGP